MFLFHNTHYWIMMDPEITNSSAKETIPVMTVNKHVEHDG